MKTATHIFILWFFCLSTLSIKAQQSQNAAPANNTHIQTTTGVPANYAYKIYKAPNNTYGYDIFKNNKGVFHQPANANPKDKTAFLQQASAEKAANLSIDKLKKNALPKLSPQEIKKLLNN